MPRLKVYRTSIGFHDAYVAAPSQKAALEAWGADSNLFAIGSAEVETDPVLTADPLAAPGRVIKRSRGDVGDHLRAADHGRTKGEISARAPRRTSAKPSKPRPSRKKLDAAENALTRHQTNADGELAAIDARLAALQDERRSIERRLKAATARLERQFDQARAAYDRALERWRSAQ